MQQSKTMNVDESGKETTIGFRASKELKEDLKELAKKDNRKLSDYCHVKLAEIVQREKDNKK